MDSTESPTQCTSFWVLFGTGATVVKVASRSWVAEVMLSDVLSQGFAINALEPASSFVRVSF